jgi:hypothetical protein
MLTYDTPATSQGRIQDFKLGGGAHLKKSRRAEGDAKNLGYFVWKIHTISWEAFLEPLDSYFLFADLVGFYPHWTYMHIFLNNYWWQKSGIWSQASYRYPISWEAGTDPEGGAPGAPPLKLEKNMIFWRKIVIFHTKYPKFFASPSNHIFLFSGEVPI